MEIRQLRYFVSVVEQGSLGKAAQELDLVPSTISQQLTRLEYELSTRLLQRSRKGVKPTDAGIAFFRQAQLALRHIDYAVHAAQEARLSGEVSVGLAPTTASVLGLPLIGAMRERYPDIQFHLVEALSGHLAAMLRARQIDLAIIFTPDSVRKCVLTPLLREALYVLAKPGFAGLTNQDDVTPSEISQLPLVMPTHAHGLRSILAAAEERDSFKLNIAMEVDSLAVVMDLVSAGYMATVQPGAATKRVEHKHLLVKRISDSDLFRNNLLASLPDDELSPAALATRVVMRNVVQDLMESNAWLGAARIHDEGISVER